MSVNLVFYFNTLTKDIGTSIKSPLESNLEPKPLTCIPITSSYKYGTLYSLSLLLRQVKKASKLSLEGIIVMQSEPLFATIYRINKVLVMWPSGWKKHRLMVLLV